MPEQCDIYRLVVCNARKFAYLCFALSFFCVFCVFGKLNLSLLCQTKPCHTQQRLSSSCLIVQNVLNDESHYSPMCGLRLMNPNLHEIRANRERDCLRVSSLTVDLTIPFRSHSKSSAAAFWSKQILLR